MEKLEIFHIHHFLVQFPEIDDIGRHNGGLPEIRRSILYSGPSILRPPMGPRKCGLILQVVLK